MPLKVGGIDVQSAEVINDSSIEFTETDWADLITLNFTLAKQSIVSIRGYVFAESDGTTAVGRVNLQLLLNTVQKDWSHIRVPIEAAPVSQTAQLSYHAVLEAGSYTAIIQYKKITEVFYLNRGKLGFVSVTT